MVLKQHLQHALSITNKHITVSIVRPPAACGPNIVSMEVFMNIAQTVKGLGPGCGWAPIAVAGPAR